MAHDTQEEDDMVEIREKIRSLWLFVVLLWLRKKVTEVGFEAGGMKVGGDYRISPLCNVEVRTSPAAGG